MGDVDWSTPVEIDDRPWLPVPGRPWWPAVVGGLGCAALLGAAALVWLYANLPWERDFSAITLAEMEASAVRFRQWQASVLTVSFWLAVAALCWLVALVGLGMALGRRTFRAPPGWPEPPRGWVPWNDWRPDPAWPPAPDGWRWWRRGSRR